MVLAGCEAWGLGEACEVQVSLESSVWLIGERAWVVS